MSLVFNIPNGTPGYLPDVPNTLREKNEELYRYLIDFRRECVKSINGLLDNDLALAEALNNDVMMTPEGGIAVKLLNKTGAASVKGNMVSADHSTDMATHLIIKDEPDPIGCFYESGIADGAYAWVVVSGIAEVYFVGNTTRGQLARGFLTADGASYVTGQALAENVPTSPFATDKHFYEIGHILESRTGAGLAKVIMHFN